MNKKEQQDRFMGLVNRIAMEAVEQPPAERAAFIKQTVDDMRQDYGTAFPDPTARAKAHELADKLEELANALVAIMDKSGGGKPGNA